jgi:hypothetical protein
MSRGLVAAILMSGLGAIAAGSLGTIAATPQPVWTEVAWPFPMDQWGKGKAFVCRASDCGTEVRVYVRAKIGFCNCATGVADDQELDRISDFELFDNRLTAQRAGEAVTVGWMKGRARAFSLAGGQSPGRSALAVGFNDRCDAIVATAVAGLEDPAPIQGAVLAFLNSQTVLRWAEGVLGL